MTSIAIIGSRGFPSTYGGFETFVRRLAPYLRDAGAEVTVYCRDRSPIPGTYIDEFEGVRRIHSRGWNTKSASTLTHGYSSFRDARGRAFDAALVLNVANGFFLPMLRRAGTPTAVNVDGLEWERGKWGPAARWVFRRGALATAKYADEIVVDSVALRGVWQNTFGRSSTFIPYGGDVVDRDSAPHDELAGVGVTKNSYLLVVARLVPENNVDTIVDAIEKLDFRIPTVVVGSAGVPNPLEERLRTLAGAHENFHWLGHVDDQRLLRQLWQHCALYIHGHSVGGTNPALLQAAGYGAPIIAYDSVFNREVLTSNDDCFFPVDADALARKIADVMDDSGRRTAMTATNQGIVTERYQWDDVCADYAAMLYGLAGRVRPRTAGPRSASKRKSTRRAFVGPSSKAS